MKKIIICALISLKSILMYSQQYDPSTDWAFLTKYAQDNQELISSKAKIDVVFMGNSITEGWNYIEPEFFKNNHYVNRGIGGQTSSQMVLRFYQDVILLNPKVVIILTGINDIAANQGPTSNEMIQHNIKAMVDMAHAHNLKIIICSILPANRFSWRPTINPTQRVLEMNHWIEQFCSDKKIYFCNYVPSLTDANNGLRNDLGEDGVHPNKKGYEIMKSILAPIIKTALYAK